MRWPRGNSPGWRSQPFAPGFDPAGRLIYQSKLRVDLQTARAKHLVGMQPMSADSSPILRADFDARTVDTIA
jgi:hypothetical protein